MKKLILLVAILAYSTTITAQNLTYGATLGTSFYDIDGDARNISNSGELGKIPINFGGFINYQLSDSYGIKTTVLFSLAEEDYDTRPIGGKLSVKKTLINLTPHFKFDTNGEYNKGFYLLAGPRLSFVINTENQDGINLDNFYKSTTFGVQFGFGTDFLQHFSIELIGDYGLTDYLDFDDSSNTAGAYFNFNVNLDSLLNK